MYIKKIVLKNIRCLKDIKIDFDLSDKKPPWTVVLGDNSAGKTTLLRSIAIGLCDESSAAGLLKESDSGYVSYGEKTGQIVIYLEDKNKSFRITTIIEHKEIKNGFIERVRQKTSENFPWHRLFVAGYGAGRGTSGTGDIAGYAVINAVYNMFNYGEGLQNPELTIRRFKNIKTEDEAKRILQEILDVQKVNLSKSGITIDGNWGKKMPLRDLADGYKSTFIWITDLLGWAISYDDSIKKAADIQGIVLIDEIEQHLHATWQRVLIKQLKELFPKIQFIAATHSPLIAASIGEIGPMGTPDKLILCENVTGLNQSIVKALGTMQGYRFEQVLASRAFKYLCEANPSLEWAIKRASELTDKGTKRSASEKKEYKKLKSQLKGAPFLQATTPISREIDREEMKKLKNIEEKSIHDKNKKR